MSRRSLQRILRELHLFPYKLQLVQALQPTDLQSRLAYAVHIQQLAREQNEFIHNLTMSNEAHFHLNGFVLSAKFFHDQLSMFYLQNPEKK